MQKTEAILKLSFELKKQTLKSKYKYFKNKNKTFQTPSSIGRISEDPTTNYLHPPSGNPHGNPGSRFSYHGNHPRPPSTTTWSNRKSFATLDRSSFTGSSFNDVIAIAEEINYVNGGEKVNLGLKEAKSLFNFFITLLIN